MAQPTPLTPGFGAGFDAAKFRAAIEDTMTMGLPNATSERATFRWLPDQEWSVHDQRGKPYNWTATPTTNTQHADVRIPVAVEFSSNARNAGETTVGSFNEPRVIVTVLDTHFAEVDGADLIIFDNNTYKIEFVAPPIGLFGVTIYQIFARAVDET